MKRARVVLLGVTGQVGWALRPRLALRYEVMAPTRSELDLADLQRVEGWLEQFRPQAIVNAAAYTAVDRAEEEKAAAFLLNGELPRVLARFAAESRAVLLHYSTDYVFDGVAMRPYREEDTPNPLNVYGASKRAGEEAILASGAAAAILRTSWVYGLHGNNFLKTILRLGQKRERLQIVADQIGAPTSAELIAEVSEIVLARLLAGDRGAVGLFHLTAAGAVSWYGYARFLLEVAAQSGWPLRVKPETVEPIASADYPARARRPANSCMDCSRLQEYFGVVLPDWQEEVARLVKVLVELAGSERAG
ncbi:MAG: dTDP-4-dehydrorhamnose reductase [Hydrogenophilus sp.]|nr:dTDP-4-dehydrorhamnose reductase [Hydrogenophilus sp.]